MEYRIVWNESECRKHGQCDIAAPDIFRLDVDGTLHIKTEIDDSLIDQAWAAADACPEQAITIVQIEETA